MMRYHVLIFVFVVAAISSISGLVGAAEIRVDPSRGRWGAVLEGTIEQGDAEKLRRFISLDHTPVELFLASPGGDLSEAMKIGALVRKLKMITVVPENYPGIDFIEKIAEHHGLKNYRDNYICASACFFVFVAGVYRDSEFVGMKEPLIGIHKPYLSSEDQMTLDSDQAIKSARDTKNIVGKYLLEMGVSHKYEDEMFSIPKTDVRWISHDEFNTDFKGVIPQLKDWVDARCNKLTSAENKFWNEHANSGQPDLAPSEKAFLDSIFQKHLAQYECEHDLIKQLSLEASLGWLESSNH